MQDFPHHYIVNALETVEGDVDLTADRLPHLRTTLPSEFGGPGDRWSPETLFVGAAADCFMLTFRGIARASKLSWTSLQCEANGTLDRVDRVTQFTRLDLRAHLVVPVGTDTDQARRVLEKAEHTCLISNSLKASTHLEADIEVAMEPVGALASA